MSNDPELKRINVNGVDLACYERNSPSADRPSLFFLHCTGFHARVWDRIVEQFPLLHVVALDQRGHGRSEKRPITHWKVFGEDAAAVVGALGLTRIIGIGHSVGGHALVDAAAKSRAFAELILCDPTIAAPDAYGLPVPFLADGETHPAAKRRGTFASPEQMLERLQGRGSYSLFDSRMLWDYCQYGLLPNSDGDFSLACPPHIEASVYSTSRTNGGVYHSARALDIPVLVLRAKLPPAERQAFDFASSPTYPGLVDAFRFGREVHLRDCTHFIPMQMPHEVVNAIQGAVSAWKPGEQPLLDMSKP